MTTLVGSPQARELAAQYEQVTATLLTVAEACDDAQWHTRCANEERSVGVLVHHLASFAATAPELVGHVVAGDPPPPLTQEMVDHANARHAAMYAHVGQAETLDLVRTASATTAAYIRSLSAHDLAQRTHIPFAGPGTLSVDQLISFLLIGHTLGHLSSIQVALDNA